MDELNRRIGKELQIMRKERRITQRQVAEQQHKTTACISKYESGDIALDIESLCKYCAVLNISPSEFLQPFVPDGQVIKSTEPPLPFYNVPELFLYWRGGVDGSIFSAKMTFLPYASSLVRMRIVFNFCTKPALLSSSKSVFEGEIEIFPSITRALLRKTGSALDLILVTAYNAGEGNNYRIGHITTLTSYYSPMSSKCIISQEIIPDKETVIELLQASKDEISQLKRSGIFLPLNTYKKTPHESEL